MALPATWSLAADLEEFAQTAKSPEPHASPSSAYRFWKSAVDRYIEQLADMQRSLNRIEARAEEIVQVVKATLGPDTLALLNEAIGAYSQAEEDLREQFLPAIDDARKRKQAQFSLPVSPGDRARAIRMWERQGEIYSRILEVVRDLRWNLMALRATVEPSGDSPVFSDPVALERYLDEL